eukprot:2586528-Rhodomonas_salina.2
MPCPVTWAIVLLCPYAMPGTAIGYHDADLCTRRTLFCTGGRALVVLVYSAARVLYQGRPTRASRLYATASSQTSTKSTRTWARWFAMQGHSNPGARTRRRRRQMMCALPMPLHARYALSGTDIRYAAAL